MQIQLFKSMKILALIAGLVLLNVGMAQAVDGPPAGSSPESALSPTVGWATVSPGESHWYTFNYDYDDDDPAQAIATLQMASAGQVGFIVQTLDRLGPWLDEDDDPGALGVGSPLYVGRNDDHDVIRDAQTLVWAGSAKASGDYLIIVEGDGAYHLTVEGDTVNFKQPSLENAVAFVRGAPAHEMVDEAMANVAEAVEGPMDEGVMTETFALTVEPAAAAIARSAGTGPENAVAPTIGWATVSPEENHWYIFNYDYDGDRDNAAEQAIAQLEMINADSVRFEVQTLDRLGPYEYDDDIPGPLGVGSPLYLGNDDDGDGVFNPHKLVWMGSARATGSYYIIVEGDGAYQLTVTGDTVHFPEKSLDSNPAFAMMSK